MPTLQSLAVKRVTNITLDSTREGICQIPGHLLHPIPVGLLRNPDHLNLPCGIINTDQDIITCQALPGINLRGEEINGCQGFPMGLDELGPSGLPASVGAGIISVPIEHLINRGMAYLVAQML